MTLRDALSDFKRHRGNATRFPGERRTTAGRFSGLGGRLVHVGPHGSLRDYSYPLSGRYGIDRSRFGVRRNGELVWFDSLDSTQRYDDGTALVVTEHEAEGWSLTQYDLTLDDAHLTCFVENEGIPDDAELVAYLGFAPDGRDDRIGQLRNGDAVEVFHAEEHDYLAAAPRPSAIDGLVPANFETLLSDRPQEVPPMGDAGRYEESRLSGELVVSLALDGGATLASLLADHGETPREDALSRVRELASKYDSAKALRAAAEKRSPGRSPDATLDAPTATAVTDDLRVLSFLSADTGARIAGPDFDPFYRYSGGYGYTWFRDDAEISRFLLAADGHFDLSLSDWHARSARLYCETQRDDGTWPHRVWPRDGTIAPGWANARVEAGDGADYQADQTGSVIAFLATYLRTRNLDSDLESTVRETLRAALDGLDDTLEADGLPIHCQNAWENMTGRFAHTAATYLEAYAELARAPVADDLRDRALDGANAVLDGLDELWTGEFYALRLVDGERDERLDSSALALAAAHRAAAAVVALDAEQVDRIVSHTEAVLDGLWRDPNESPVRGLARFERDDWRVREQDAPKIWTVSTAWGANAASELSTLLSDRDDRRAEAFSRRSRDLLALLLPDGPLCADSGYLPEQFFDAGAADSATPLGWPHAIRLATVAALDERDALESEEVKSSLD
ncbi:Glucoamylase and related glycosyl hydrolase- like protein [Haladaptatus paucihalophilus DX253]|uniref:Glucoamylase (Glucan-1,4-alpha-glucosidase), GH15 family n=1 Tax=Haladaptatus paucihalophilus DX253 TaxID=797209 RepID=E7QR72_HALPU|nr:glycoside hydrolase family 15 protein [Haladaptatus paucihalophilus]EFW92980.1 Glucoamylase and related glycosyl hydrolase- like protein [Haladaptatus paucihalophilus DX253]SHL17646.1 Glucoamylase (glucan-1,4-alpha-glucosidase), GH15 family [Haladaptatus paucihalophilus DX253]